MATKKISLNELKSLIGKIIKEESPVIKYVYVLDAQGKPDLKKMIGTHQYGKGFIPNQLGIKMGFEKNPTSIPNGTRMVEPTMANKKISLNELKSLIGKIIKEEIQIIKEETDPYNGKIEKILSDISKVKSQITNKSPETFVRDGFIYLSAEDGSYFADYYGEFNGEEMYIDSRLEKIADKYDMMWDWENPGTIILGY